MKNRKEYSTQLRALWRANGKCSHCGGDKSEHDVALCSGCKKKKKENWHLLPDEKKESYKEMKSNGAKRLAVELKKQGICVRCRKNKSEQNKVQCSQCLLEVKERTRKRFENGICMTCKNKAIDGQYYCEPCADRKNQKGRDRKWEAIALKGGKCEKCNLVATKNNFILFDFNHLDKSEKESTLSALLKGNSISDKARSELDKCNLLCVFCHRMYHFLSEEEWEKYKGEIR